MIRLLVFDLDGTLVETERLKAESYARAAHELDPRIAEQDVVEAYKEVVGRSRQEVATALMQRFGLEDEAREHMAELEASEPWEAFVGVRLRYYHAMLDDADLIRSHRRPAATALVRHARSYACKLALATTSTRDTAGKVLRALGLADAFDFTATADDVAATKPDPEVYYLVTDALGVPPAESLALEDSPAGIAAARAAGLACIAVPTDFTRARVHEAVRQGLIEERWVVDEPATLPEVVRALLAERADREEMEEGK